MPLTYRTLPVLALFSVGAAAPSALAQSYAEQAALDSQLSFGANSGFGHAVDLDGDTAAVGVPHPGAGGVSGHVVVYRRAGSTWIQEADLIPSDGTTGNYFGWSVALDGDTLVAGAIGAYVQGLASAGAAYVFTRSGTTWSEQQKLVAGSPLQGAEFGHAVALDGATLAVGAPQATTAAMGGRGGAYVFALGGSTWTQVDVLAGTGTVFGARNGSSVAIDGDLMVVGARTTSEDGATTLGVGSGYVFRRTAGIWSQEAKLLPAGYQAWAAIGSSAALRGGRVVLGAEGENQQTGAAYVFDRGGTTWTETGRLASADTDAGDLFGRGVDVWGDLVAVGAPNFDNPLPNGNGAVKVFAWDGLQWVERLELVGSVMTSGDTLGDAVAIQGTTVVGGSPSLAFGQIGKAWIWSVDAAAAETYCTGKTTSVGCVPFITLQGTPSASSTSPFVVRAEDAVPGEAGFLIYGFKKANLSFHGGKLCVKAPFVRTPAKLAKSVGAGCSGWVLARNVNTTIQSGADPALTAGATVFAQWRQRDPAGAFGDALSDGVRFAIAP